VRKLKLSKNQFHLKRKYFMHVYDKILLQVTNKSNLNMQRKLKKYN